MPVEILVSVTVTWLLGSTQVSFLLICSIFLKYVFSNDTLQMKELAILLNILDVSDHDMTELLN